MRLNAPATLAFVALMTTTEAHRGLLTRRGYQFSRPSATDNAFALVSDIFATPYFHSHHLPSQMNSMMRQLASSAAGQEGSSGGTNTPPYEVYHNTETNTVELTMEIPGVSSKNLSVELENDNLLTIKGTRLGRSGGQSYKSNFEQMFELDSDVDPSRLKVTLSAGILRVEAPKKMKKLESIKIDVEDVPVDELFEEEDMIENEEVVEDLDNDSNGADKN